MQDKLVRQSMALHRIATSTWGAMFNKARTVYTSIIRLAMTYGAPIWFSLIGKEATKPSLTRQLGTIQNCCLCIVLGAYKATPIPLLELETGIPPIQTYLSTTQVQY